MYHAYSLLVMRDKLFYRNDSMTDQSKLIAEYQTAIRSMRKGEFNFSIPFDDRDDVGKLGCELNEFAQELEKKFDGMVKVREIAEEITSGLLVDDVLNRVYHSFRKVIPYDRMGCALLINDKKEAVAYWSKSDVSKVELKVGYVAAMAGSSLQEIIETGQPRILNDLEAHLAEHPASVSTQLILKEGIHSSLTCPLISRGDPLGFLFFSSTGKETYKDIHQDVFLQIGEQVSNLIEKSRLYQQLYELNQKLLMTQSALQHQATHDALTKIYSRGAIIEHLEVQLARCKRQNQPLSIIMLDVDHFKEFNDAYGHLAGDAVLRSVATRMKDCLREYDYIGRYGGEEFLVVLGNTDYDTAVKTATRLNQIVMAETVAFGDKRLTVTISAGVAVANNCTMLNEDQIIMAADQALYQAKTNGRNRVEASRI